MSICFNACDIKREECFIKMLKDKILYTEEMYRLPITKRIEKMREDVVNAKPILCSERAILVTDQRKKPKMNLRLYEEQKEEKYWKT